MPSASTRALFQSEPPRDAAMRLCLEAWGELDSERALTAVIVPTGIGTFTTKLLRGSIPWRAVQAWCEAKGLRGIDAEIVRFVLRQLDDDHAARETARLNKK